MATAKPKKREHYHVLTGLQGGYLPNTNEAFRKRGEAHRYAVDLAKQERADGRKVRKVGPGLFTVGKYEMIEVVACSEPWANCKDPED